MSISHFPKLKFSYIWVVPTTNFSYFSVAPTTTFSYFSVVPATNISYISVVPATVHQLGWNSWAREQLHVAGLLCRTGEFTECWWVNIKHVLSEPLIDWQICLLFQRIWAKGQFLHLTVLSSPIVMRNCVSHQLQSVLEAGEGGGEDEVVDLLPW